MEKIQELTQKIYHEGVEKGQQEADRIIAEAKQQAEQILSDARDKAEAIEAAGRKSAVELDTNTKNELKLYTSQALSALKSEVANCVTSQIVSDAAGKLAQDKDFLQKFMVALAAKWVETEPIVISAEDSEGLKAYFAKEAKAVMDKGVTIKKVNGHDTLFTIEPADGSYKVNFGQQEFETYFKNFLRPQLIDMLF